MSITLFPSARPSSLMFARRGTFWLYQCCAALLLAGAGCELAENYPDPEGPRYAGQYASDPTAAWLLPRAKLVTFNIRFSREHERAAQELLSSPALRGADILLLQEMDAEGTEHIAAALALDYVYYPGSVQHGRDFGNAVLSRWPIVDDAKLILPHKSPADGRLRIAVCARLQTPFGDVRAYSIHTETPWLGPRARLDQARAVLEDARTSDLPTIIAGDFNTGDPGALDETIGLHASEGFVWASREAGDSLGTLDSTFVRHWAPLGSGTARTQASDHRPLWVDVELIRR